MLAIALLNMGGAFLFNIYAISKLGSNEVSDLAFLGFSVSGFLVLIFTSGASGYFLSELSKSDTAEKRIKFSCYISIYVLFFLIAAPFVFMISYYYQGIYHAAIFLLGNIAGLFVALLSICNVLSYSLGIQLKWELVNFSTLLGAMVALWLTPLDSTYFSAFILVFIFTLRLAIAFFCNL